MKDKPMEEQEMKFLQAIENIKRKQARKAGTRAYYNNGDVYLSRLYGYNLISNRYIPKPEYSEAIKLIFEMLEHGSSLPEIKHTLDTRGYRDSSHNRYCLSRIISLVRPVYAGFLKRGLGFVKVSNIEPLVTLETYKLAKRALDIEKSKIDKVYE
jgi:hypothetical protein